MMEPNLGIALLLPLLAGLSTTIGSVIGLFARKPGPRTMALSLGVAAGVMILISFTELLPEGIEVVGFFWGYTAFFGGMAIALHNIPEGLAISVPVYAATGSRAKAFLWSFLSGIAEPIGAVVAALFLLPFLSETSLSLVLAAVAGVMVFISLDELVPVARSFCGEEHWSILGVGVGMAVMAASLWLLG